MSPNPGPALRGARRAWLPAVCLTLLHTCGSGYARQPALAIADALRDADSDRVPDRLGATVTVEGTIVSPPVLLSLAASLANLQDDTGGVALFTRDTSILMDRVRLGDYVRVRGTVTQYFGLEQLAIVEIQRLRSGTPPKPRDTLVGDLLGERYSGQLVHVVGQLIVPSDGRGADAQIVLRDRSGEIPVLVPSRLLRDATFARRLSEGGEVGLVGILGQADRTPPYDTGYQLIPRSADDFAFAPVPPYRAMATTAALLLAGAGGTYLFVRRRSAERRAREMGALSQELSRSRAALAAEKERLAVTLASIADGVMTTDGDGRITSFNPGAQALTGWREADALGQSADAVLSGRWETTANGTILRTITTRAGAERVIEESSSPIRDPHGEVGGRVVVFRDITERQRIEEERQKANKLESIGVLAGGIAHDFNNILTAILGRISLARRFAGQADQQREQLVQAEGAARRARHLTHQLLAFAKGGAPVKKPLEVSTLLHSAAQLALGGANVACEYDIPPDLPPIMGDEGQLTQVFSNLIINACQAMPGGGVVTVSAKRHDAEVEISVSDRGTGIPPEHLSKIFDPYFTTKPRGSGLGLTTSYTIVKNHGGQMAVRSEVGAGTTFDIRLPASEEALPDEAWPERPISRARGRVLVVDDEEIVRGVARDLLADIGYDVETASDGAEAVAMYADARRRRRRFDVVLMDLTIPGGMGGKEAVTRLLEMDPAATVVASSGYADDPVLAAFRSYGFAGVVQKPYAVEELGGVLAAVIAERRS